MFDIIGWYMRYLAHWEQRDWQDECVSTSEEDEPQNSKKHTCGHHDNHPFEHCNQASMPEKARDNTEKTGEEEYDDLPSLIALSDKDEDDDYQEEELNNGWFWEMAGSPLAEAFSEARNERPAQDHLPVDVESTIERLSKVLTENQLFPRDESAMDPILEVGSPRFVVELIEHDLVQIYNRVQGFDSHIHILLAQSSKFSIEKWYAEQCAYNSELSNPWQVAQQWEERHLERISNAEEGLAGDQERFNVLPQEQEGSVELGGVQVDQNKYPAFCSEIQHR